MRNAKTITALNWLSIVCGLVQKPDRYLTRVLINDHDEPVFEAQSLEAMGCKIDMLKMMEQRRDE
jgi:hypothetical protein